MAYLSISLPSYERVAERRIFLYETIQRLVLEVDAAEGREDPQWMLLVECLLLHSFVFAVIQKWRDS